MAGISNIIGAYNINPKRVSSKLSFEVGQVFSAKIVSADEMNKEIILKLLDGWQFPAKLQNLLDFMPEGLVKFQVEGFQEGKLQLKLINHKDEKQDTNKSSLEDLIKDGNIDVDKEDYNILRKMVKHDMPLTKDNISKVKTLVEFRERLFNNEQEADNFIVKYVNNKNIDINSLKGKEISNALKGFFNALKNISEDELLTLLENNIEINEDNIKSFVKIFRGESSIYKELKAAKEEMNFQKVINKADNNESDEMSETEEYSIDNIIEKELQNSNITEQEKALYKDLKKLMNNEGNNIKEEASVNKKFSDIPHKEIDDVPQEKQKPGALSDVQKSKNAEVKANTAKLDKNTFEAAVKEQFAAKTEEMKEIIKNILGDKKVSSSESYGKILQTLKESINDFRVFNSVSNQYYYLDIPVNVNREDYQCKLLIKDDRKSGKKIDSKNVSLVVSVKTLKIGVVDAYIKVRDQNMNVDIKCEEEWVKILSAGRDIILKELSNLGYNVFFNVDKKIAEANLANCREFFDDNEIGSINIKV